jgi:hypothetical protein
MYIYLCLAVNTGCKYELDVCHITGYGVQSGPMLTLFVHPAFRLMYATRGRVTGGV